MKDTIVYIKVKKDDIYHRDRWDIQLFGEAGFRLQPKAEAGNIAITRNQYILIPSRQVLQIVMETNEASEAQEQT